jgi:hypothetical protein
MDERVCKGAPAARLDTTAFGSTSTSPGGDERADEIVFTSLHLAHHFERATSRLILYYFHIAHPASRLQSSSPVASRTSASRTFIPHEMSNVRRHNTKHNPGPKLQLGREDENLDEYLATECVSVAGWARQRVAGPRAQETKRLRLPRRENSLTCFNTSV